MAIWPPGFWRVAFSEVQRRGDRVVRLLLPSAGPDLCSKVIAQEGYANLGGRADEAKTGRTLFNRPGLRQLVAEGKVKVLVAETLDRFSRNMRTCTGSSRTFAG